jgi:hypothetical protein
MTRWWLVAVCVLACSKSDDKRSAPADEPSQGELEARAIRESFRVVLADFHADVTGGRLDAAYTRLAPMYRAGVTAEQFATVAKHPLFQPGVTFTVRGTSATAGTAKVSALANGTFGTSQLDLRCTHVDGAWKIAGLSADGAPVLPTP